MIKWKPDMGTYRVLVSFEPHMFRHKVGPVLPVLYVTEFLWRDMSQYQQAVLARVSTVDLLLREPVQAM